MAGAFDVVTPKPDLEGLTDTGYTVADIEGMGDFSRGVRQGTRDLGSALYGAGGLTAGALGFDTTRDTLLRKSNEQSNLSGVLAKPSDKLLDVDGLGSAVDYVQHGLGYLVPSLATALVTGGGGAVAGRIIAGRAVKGLTEAAAKAAVEKGVTRGAVAGAYGGSFAQEAGSIYPDAIKEGVAHPELRSVAGGAIAAGLDVLPEVMAARRIGLLPKPSKALAEVAEESTLKRTAKAAGVQALAESGTEGAQTVVERVAAGQDPFSHEGIKDIIESAALGGLGGMALGGLGGLRKPSAPVVVNKPDLSNAVAGLLEYKQTPVAYTDSFGGVTIRSVPDTEIQDTINQNLESGPASMGLTQDVVAAQQQKNFYPPVVAGPLSTEYTGGTTPIVNVDPEGTATVNQVPSLASAADQQAQQIKARDLGLTPGTIKAAESRAKAEPVDTTDLARQHIVGLDKEIDRTRKFHADLTASGTTSTPEDAQKFGVDTKYSGLKAPELRNRVKLVKDLELKKSLTMMAVALDDRTSQMKAVASHALLDLVQQRHAATPQATTPEVRRPATGAVTPATEPTGVATPIAGVAAPEAIVGVGKARVDAALKGKTDNPTSYENFDKSQLKRALSGNPITVYHGSPEEIKGDIRVPTHGAFFAESKSSAKDFYAGDKGHVVQAKLQVKNPYLASNDEVNMFFDRDYKGASKLISDLKKKGHDSIYLGMESGSWVVFDKNTVKQAADKKAVVPKARVPVSGAVESSLLAAAPVRATGVPAPQIKKAIKAPVIDAHSMIKNEKSLPDESPKGWGIFVKLDDGKEFGFKSKRSALAFSDEMKARTVGVDYRQGKPKEQIRSKGVSTPVKPVIKKAASELTPKVKSGIIKKAIPKAEPEAKRVYSKDEIAAFEEKVGNASDPELKAMIKEHPIMELHDYTDGKSFDPFAAAEDLIGHGPYNPKVKPVGKVTKAKAQESWDQVAQELIDQDDELGSVSKSSMAGIRDELRENHPDVVLRFGVDTSGAVQLMSLDSLVKRKGNADRAMRDFTKWLDKSHAFSSLMAIPGDPSMKLSDLVAFYRKHGYRMGEEQPYEDARLMYRNPKVVAYESTQGSKVSLGSVDKTRPEVVQTDPAKIRSSAQRSSQKVVAEFASDVERMIQHWTGYGGLRILNKVGGGELAASYSKIRDLITVSIHGMDRPVVFHESMHRLIEQGLIPSRVLQNIRNILGIGAWDRNGINNQAPKGNAAYNTLVAFMKQTGRGHVTQDRARWFANDEVIAYAAELWMEYVGQTPKGQIQKIMSGIKALFVEIRNKLLSMDYKNLNEFYRAVDSGFYAAKQPSFARMRASGTLGSVKQGGPDGRFSRIRDIFAPDQKFGIEDIPAQDIKNLPVAVTKGLPKTGNVTRRSFIQRISSLLGQGAIPSNFIRLAGSRLVQSAVKEAVIKTLPRKMMPWSALMDASDPEIGLSVNGDFVDSYPSAVEELKGIGAIYKEGKNFVWDSSVDYTSPLVPNIIDIMARNKIMLRDPEDGNDPHGILKDPKVAEAAEKAGWIELRERDSEYEGNTQEWNPTDKYYKDEGKGGFEDWLQKEWAKHGVEYVFDEDWDVDPNGDLAKSNRGELASVLSFGADKTATLMADSVRRAFSLIKGTGSVTHKESLSYFGVIGDKLRGVASGIPGVASVSKLIANNMGLNTVLHIRDANRHIHEINNHVTHLMEFDSIKNAWRTDADALAQQMMEMPKEELQTLAKVLMDETAAGTFTESPKLSKESMALYKNVHGIFKRFAVDLRASTLARIDRQFTGKVEPEAKSKAIAEAVETIKNKYSDPEASKKKEIEEGAKRIDANPTIKDKDRAKAVSGTRIENKYAQPVADITRAEIAKATQRINAQFADQLLTKKKMKSDVEDEFSRMTSRPYFPFSRFGEYTLEYVAKNGERVFQLFESLPQRETALQEARTAGAKDIQTSVLDKEIQKSGALMMPVSMIRSMSDGLGLSGEQQSRVEQLLFKLSNPQSFMKHYIHRKNVQGYTTDMVRSFASYFTVGSSYIARAKMLDTLTNDIEAIRDSKTGGDTTILAEIANNLGTKLGNTMMPGEEWSAIKQAGFMISLAAVPKAALVNLSAIFMIGAPYLAAHYGAVRTGASLHKALTSISFDNGRVIVKNASPELQAAIAKAERYGIIAQSMISEIGSLASAGMESWRYKRILGVPLGRIFHTASALFTKAEEINRHVIFQMAWNMEMAKSKDTAQAYAVAVNAIQRTMFEYSRWNRPDLLRGGLKGTVFQFKNFLIQYTKLLLAPLGKSDPKERMASIYMLSSLMFMAGMIGMPGAEDFLDILDTLLSTENSKFDSRRKAKETLGSLFGDPFADVLLHGITRATPFDLSASFSAGRLIPGVEAIFDKSKQKAEEVYAALGANLGPVAQWGANTMAAMASDSPDDWKRIEKAMPNFMKHPSAAFRWATRGEETDSADRPIKTDFSPLDIGGKALGFTPTSLSKKRELLWEMTKEDKFFQGRRDALIDRIAFTLLNNKGDVGPLVQDVIKFNNDITRTGFGMYAIGGRDINNSLTARVTARELLVPKKQYSRYQQESARL